ncbi:serine/threonine-protein kinase [Mycobacterium sp.]|uniref:serine/threonine-protein kinase n=1 Tax=Mycobacterium sp. TaxID=1785 RepID=UPI003C755F05
MALASGAPFAGYTVVRRLGSGKTGDVYLVQRPGSPGWQALKVLRPQMSMDGEFRRRFHQETAILANLYHPHIVGVHDRGEFDGQLWVAMEYVDGVSGAQLMADRFPAVAPIGEVLAIITGVAGALDHAHQRGLLHRDVKPANILLTGPGEGEQRILLTDFGIPPQLGAPTGGNARNLPEGTVGYVAPEQLMGADVDGRADEYALAATAFYLLTGAPPVQQSDPGPPRLSDQRPELARLDGVFGRALATSPTDRFDSCGEFADAVNERVGVARGDRSPEAAFVVDYPAYAWFDNDAPRIESAPAPAPAPAPVPRKPQGRDRPAQSSPGADRSAAAPKRRKAFLTVLATAAVVLMAGLLALGVVIGRETTNKAATPAAAPTTSAAAAPTTSAPPVPLDGTYRIDVARSKQTFNFTPNPQPPDVTTWWAFRSACTATTCVATGTLLDDNSHTHAREPTQPLILDFANGYWLSRADAVPFPCVGPSGEPKTQLTLQALSLRLQARDELVGEMKVIVQSNECGQQNAVVRVPTVATRDSGVPPGVTLPDPATISPGTPPSSEAPPTPTTSRPGR